MLLLEQEVVEQFQIAVKSAEGLSGRALRKIPFQVGRLSFVVPRVFGVLHSYGVDQAHAFFVRKPTCSKLDFVRAIRTLSVTNTLSDAVLFP
mgnify:CR=1 FL=1